LLLHTPHAQRNFLRIDSVHALQNEKLAREFEAGAQGVQPRDAWFYPYPGDDVDAVTKEGFQSMNNSPIRFGLYFLDEKLASGCGPTLKMVLCKILPGKSLCRTEDDVAAITRCPSGYSSVYVPAEPPVDSALAMDGFEGHSEASLPFKSVFNDTYILFDSSLALPTHVVSYHFEVDQAAVQDGELLRWVNTQCQTMFGFVQNGFAEYFVSLAQTSDSVSSLTTRLRDQADVPSHLAANFAKDLFERVPRSTSMLSPSPIAAGRVPTVVGTSLLNESLGLLNLPAAEQGTMSGKLSVEALARIEQEMASLDEDTDDLKELLLDQDNTTVELDQQLYERSGVFKAELLTYLKDYMLTLQVAEERQQQMMHVINDVYNLREYMEQQRDSMTKVALLTQWKNLEPLRNNLKQRLLSVAGLQGQSLSWLTPLEEDPEVQELKRQVQQKDRVVKILAQRLRASSGKHPTAQESELLSLI